MLEYVNSWYIGPSLDHYRCVKCYIPRTGSIIDVDTVDWFPHHISFPTVTKEDQLVKAAEDIVSVLQAPTPVSPNLTFGNEVKYALLKIATPSKPMSLPDPVPINPADTNQYELLTQEADQPIQSKATNPTSPTIIQQPNQLESNVLNGNSTSKNPSTVKQIVTTAIHEALQLKPKKNPRNQQSPTNTTYIQNLHRTILLRILLSINNQILPQLRGCLYTTLSYQHQHPSNTFDQLVTLLTIAISLCNTYKPNNSSVCHKSITSLMKTVNE